MQHFKAEIFHIKAISSLKMGRLNHLGLFHWEQLTTTEKSLTSLEETYSF